MNSGLRGDEVETVGKDGKEREDSRMTGHTRMNERMDH